MLQSVRSNCRGPQLPTPDPLQLLTDVGCIRAAVWVGRRLRDSAQKWKLSDLARRSTPSPKPLAKLQRNTSEAEEARARQFLGRRSPPKRGPLLGALEELLFALLDL